MPLTLETSTRRVEERRTARLGRLLARRRSWLFAPLFLGASAFTIARPAPFPRGAVLGGVAVVLVAWLLRIWATGYRTWVHKSGAPRYLMTAGPYAHVRHPLYVANGVSGGAALVVLGRLELLALYSVAYVLVTVFIVLREEGALAARFGADHSSYRATVPGFVPLPGTAFPADRRRGRFSWEPVRSSFELWKLLGIVAAAAFFVVRS